MPTNAEIHAAIDLLIRQPPNHILTDAIADMLDDMVDNISAGPGGTAGIDDVLAVGQALTADRIIELGANFLDITVGAEPFFEIDPASGLVSIGPFVEQGTESFESKLTLTPDVGAELKYIYTNSVGAIEKEAKIVGFADATESLLTHTADKHTFNGLVGIGGVPTANQLFNVNVGSNFFLEVDPTVNNEQVNVKAVNLTGDNNVAHLQVRVSDSEAKVLLQADFNDGVKRAQIEASADNTESLLTYQADKHTFTGAVILPTSNPGVPGAIWNNAGTPAISA